MAVDLNAEVQRLARLMQQGGLTREDFQAQVRVLKEQARETARDTARDAVALRGQATHAHRGTPIVESGPDIRAGARTFSWTLALMALAVIAVATVSAARGDSRAWRMPSLDLPRFELPRNNPAPALVAPEVAKPPVVEADPVPSPAAVAAVAPPKPDAGKP